MPSNFKILIHQNNNSTHIKLLGTFNDASARELVRALERYGTGSAKIFIHTNGLEAVTPFNMDSFYNSLSDLKLNWSGLIVSGDYSTQIAPPDALFS